MNEIFLKMASISVPSRLRHGKAISFAALVAANLCSSGSAVAAGPEVHTAQGVLAGSGSSGIDRFAGIPFAAPPVGDLRWRAPQPVVPWKGVRPAVHFGANCMQAPAAYLKADADTRFAEDCLYLNVWKPTAVAAKRPVLVWIHGGAFINGGTSFPETDGTAFARQGIVFVSINYRLGRLGFFAHPALTAAAEGPIGNYGYMDQIAALRWVKDNIAAFGGDPDRVTVMGESAGGIAVADLMVSPAAKGLFHQAIIMSGGGRAAMANHRLRNGDGSDLSAEQIGLNYAHARGIDGEGPAALAQLRALPASALIEDLVGENLKINGELRQAMTHVGGPIIDGTTKLGVIDAELTRLGGPAMPIMIGTTSADLGVPTGQDKEALFKAFAGFAPAARNAYDPDGKGPVEDVRVEVTRDRLLTEPARFVARQATATGYAAYLYRFGYVPDALRKVWKGVPHGGDITYFFATRSGLPNAKPSSADQSVATIVNAYAANFVLTGNPNGPRMPVWKAVGEAPNAVMQIGRVEETGMIADPFRDRLDLIRSTAGVPLIEPIPTAKPKVTAP